jgi:hypothetical protein
MSHEKNCTTLNTLSASGYTEDKTDISTIYMLQIYFILRAALEVVGTRV